MSKTKPIGLSEFIQQVKRDLLDEQFIDAEGVPLVAINEIEVEVSVVATREGGGSAKGGAKAGLKLSVPGFGEVGGELGGELGMEGKLSRANTQIVRVKLGPLVNTEKLLAGMKPEELEKIQAQARKYLARSGDRASTPDTA